MKTITPIPQQRRGFISVMAVSGLSMVLLLTLLVAYRYSLQTQEIQRRAQIRIDYNQREQAILRSVLNIAPNRGMIAMMGGSASVSGSENRQRWRWVFEDAVNQANGEYTLKSNTKSVLGVPTDAKSGNSGDGDQGHVRNVVTPIGSRRTGDFLITPGINGIESSLGSGFPESLQSAHSGTNDEDDKIFITDQKTYSSGARFKAIPYPDVHFGYTGQDQTFVAKRNWWGFTLALGYTSKDQTGINYLSKDYVLSIYEVPSQLALGSNRMTYFGQHADGSDWSNVSVSGSVFASKAETQGSVAFERVSSRQGVNLASGSSVGGVSHNDYTGNLETREEFEATNASFYPFSSSSDSGLVAFIPIDLGNSGFDDLSNTTDTDTNRISPTGWNAYSRPALQTIMKLRVEDVVSSTDQTPTQISFTYKAGGINTTVQFTKGVNWPSATSSEGLTFPFHVESTESGRKGLSVYVGRMTTYLAAAGADGLDVNSSLMVNANYLSNVNVKKPNIPSLATDTVFFLRNTNDLTMFPKGFSLVTPYRLYVVNDVNLISSGTDASGNPTYPPVSIFAPEKRFGIKNNAVEISFDGQLNYLGKSGSTRPLDLISGSGNEIVPENIRANLFSISDPSQLPPIAQMNWLVTIEEVRP